MSEENGDPGPSSARLLRADGRPNGHRQGIELPPTGPLGTGGLVHPVEVDRGPLRVVSYNVRYFGHALRGLASTMGPKRRVAAAIASLDPLPDIICLQEVETRSLRSYTADRHAEPTQLEAFMGRMEEIFTLSGLVMPYEAYYFPAHTYRFRKINLYTTGLAVLVHRGRLRVEHHNSEAPEQITHRPNVEALRQHKQTRICAHVRVRTPWGTPLNVFNTHLSLPNFFTKEFWARGDKMGFGRNQLQEAQLLAAFVQRYAQDEPFVVAGDFNTAPDTPVYRYLAEDVGFASAQPLLADMAGPRKRFPTAGFMHLRMHLDHLFGGGIAFEDLEGTRPFGDKQSPFFGLSDHMPLIGRLRLPE
ncbi:MAG TPA: endonuclease/exonuclease/phosphatase family protein [Myxococcaceae bacterium]|nr:endonuclease/exonuclease/phosphatase family protein [Myxococcaceae bacterium]